MLHGAQGCLAELLLGGSPMAAECVLPAPS